MPRRKTTSIATPLHDAAMKALADNPEVKALAAEGKLWEAAMKAAWDAAKPIDDALAGMIGRELTPSEAKQFNKLANEKTLIFKKVLAEHGFSEGPTEAPDADIVARMIAGGGGAKVVASPPAEVEPSPWANLPNEPITLVNFMGKFCGKKLSLECRRSRRDALTAADRNGTVKMPSLAVTYQNGSSNKYFPHDLLNAWQGFIEDKNVHLPPLLAEYNIDIQCDR